MGWGPRASWAVWVGALGVQSFHMLEHVAQVLQKFVFGLPPHGILGEALDREWVHFTYNWTLGVALVVVLLGYGLHLRFGFEGRAPIGLYSFRGVVLLQGYHLLEHVVKMMQYFKTGVPDTPGILGQVFPTILLHFAINAAVLALMFLAEGDLGLKALPRGFHLLGELNATGRAHNALGYGSRRCTR